MDRFTWATVGAVLILCLAAILSVVMPRQTQAPPDLGTPDGVVVSYMNAVRDKRADDAWALLDSPRAVEALGPPTASGTGTTQDAFRLQVNNNVRRGDRRIRIVDSMVTGDTARVDVEVTSFSDNGLFGSSSYSTTVTFNLKRQDASWRITSSPSLYQLG